MTRPSVETSARLLLIIEACAMAALSALLLILMVAQKPENLPAAIFELLFALIVTATLWKASQGPNLRSAAILINIIALPISRTLLQGDRPWIAIPLAMLALATLIALFLDRKSLS